MPRLPRLNLPGLFYHIMVRGIERRRIFRAARDYEDFLRRFIQSLQNSGSRCFAWSLMPNHIHLLILSGAQGIVKLMHPLLTGYATAFNLRYDRVGHLFQNRYKSIICEEDPYFLELVRYIPLNPARAGLVKTPAELARYPWTSHPALLGNITLPWLEVDEVLGHFGRTTPEARKAYETYIRDGWTLGKQEHLEGGGLIRSLGGLGNALQAAQEGDRQAFDPRILGDGEFVEKILKAADQNEERALAVQRSGLTLEQLRHVSANLVGIDPDRLFRRDRSRAVSRSRALFIYAATEFLGKSGKEIAEHLHMAPPSVCEARARGRVLSEEYKLLQCLGAELPKNVP